jgi:hypothetical protein
VCGILNLLTNNAPDAHYIGNIDSFEFCGVAQVVEWIWGSQRTLIDQSAGDVSSQRTTRSSCDKIQRQNGMASSRSSQLRTDAHPQNCALSKRRCHE